MKYKGSIDFICVAYAMRLPWMRPYIECLVRSIHKYVRDIDYKIYLVYNYLSDDFNIQGSDGKSDLEALQEMFGEDDKVIFVKGLDQSKTTEIKSNGQMGQGGGVYGKDGCHHSMGTVYHTEGLTLGIKEGSSKYICMVDPDLTFINEWVDDLIPLTEKYFFVSNRWMPGQLFNTTPENGKGEAVFMLTKRSNFENNNLYPNYDYRSTAGNITYFAQQNNLDFLCLNNNFWSRHYCNRWNIPYEQMEQWRTTKEYLNFSEFPDDYEEAWVGDKAILVHQIQHSMKGIDRNILWTNLIKEYLDNHE